jgi:hypothetical protein
MNPFGAVVLSTLGVIIVLASVVAAFSLVAWGILSVLVGLGVIINISFWPVIGVGIILIFFMIVVS